MTKLSSGQFVGSDDVKAVFGITIGSSESYVKVFHVKVVIGFKTGDPE